MSTRTKWLLCLALLGILIWAAASFITRTAPAPSTAPLSRQIPQPVPPPPAAPDITVIADSPFATRFGTPASTPAQDLAILADTLHSARLLVKNHREIPLADNADFTAFLSGKNPHRVAWIPTAHPSVSLSGEILDRWQTPIFFHPESSSLTTLRSAGPDRQMWTEDDVITEGLPTP